MAKPIIFLDTSILIDFLRKRSKANSYFKQLSLHNQFATSVIVKFETEIGLKTKLQTNEYLGIIGNITILPVDSACITQAVRLHAYLKQRNARIGLADELIAATAIHYQLPVATLNAKHFARIPHLRLVDLGSKKSSP